MHKQKLPNYTSYKLPSLLLKKSINSIQIISVDWTKLRSLGTHDFWTDSQEDSREQS